MKILDIISNPYIGGTETLLLQTAPYFERCGYSIDILNTWRNSAMKGPALESNLSYKELSGNSRHIHLRDVAEIVKIIRDGKYDIIQCFGIRVTLLVRILKPYIKDTPLVTALNGINLWQKWHYTFLDRITQKACTMFVPICNAIAQTFMENTGCPRGKIVVINNGTETDKFDRAKFEGVERANLGLPADKVIVTTLATLRDEKGHDFYIDTIEGLLKEFENIHFIWIGKGPLESKLRNRIKSTGISNMITMLGFVEDIRPLLSCSDIFVLPSRTEGMPRAMMEAMSMSLPCVATNVGGVGEVLEDGVSGFIADFGDVEMFGRCILDLVNNQVLRQKMGAAGRKQVVMNFDMKMITKKYMKFFELIAAGHRDGVEIQKQIDELAKNSN
jgi:glycosyltransferase involved in cell wall biosynthesis